MGIMKKIYKNKCWRWCGVKGTLLHCLWEYKLVQLLWTTVWKVLKTLNTELLYDPVPGATTGDPTHDKGHAERTWQAKADQASRDSLDLLEHLPQNQNLSYYFVPFTNSSDINRGCGVGEDSWEFLGLQGDPTSPFWRRSALGFLWKEWC